MCLSLFLGVSFVANATPIEITQIFHDTNLVVLVNGSEQVVTGDWIFKGTTDTTATDQQTSFSNRGNYAVTVTLTQASLGLVDVVVSNIDTLFVYHDSNAVYQGLIGFANGDGFPPWTRTESSFSNPDLFPTISELNIAQNTSSFNTLGPFVAGYQLADGTVIAGITTDIGGAIYGGSYDDLSSSMSARLVPIPATIWLFGSGLLGLVGVGRSKKAA